jgi:hypothetical protein
VHETLEEEAGSFPSPVHGEEEEEEVAAGVVAGGRAGRAAPRCRCKAACPARLDNIKHLDSVFGQLGLDSAALDPAKDAVGYRRPCTSCCVTAPARDGCAPA